MATRPNFRAPVSKLVQGVKPLGAAGFYGILSANHCNVTKNVRSYSLPEQNINIAYLQSVNITRKIYAIVIIPIKGPHNV